MRKLALLMFLLISASAEAQQRREVFTYFSGGQPIGEETVSFYEFGDTMLIDSYTIIQVPEPREHRARTVVMAPEDRFHDYMYWVASGDTVKAWHPDGEICAWRNTRKEPGDTCIALGNAKAVVMESGVAHHLWLLARQFARDPSGRQELKALIPQSLAGLSIARKPRQSGTGNLDGRPISVQRYGFSCAGLYQEIDADPSGEFLMLSVPIRDFQVRRRGYAPGEWGPTSPALPTEAVVVNGGGPDLPGYLTLPQQGDGPFPAVVFLHDYGPNDADFAMGPNKVFVQLAEGLAKRGIASLRYDKRTLVIDLAKERRTGQYDRDISLSEAVLDDGRAGYLLLADDPRFRDDGLFLLGHGLGGAATATVALWLEGDGESPAGIVMLAPIGRDLLTVLMEMYGYLNERGLARDQLLKDYGDQVEIYRSGDVGEDNSIIYATPRYWDSVVFYRPWEDYVEQSAPALILFGERDFIVTEADRQTWATQFAESPRPGSRLYLEPGINHIFLPSSGPMDPAEYGRPGRIEEGLLDRIAGWMKEQIER